MVSRPNRRSVSIVMGSGPIAGDGRGRGRSRCRLRSWAAPPLAARRHEYARSARSGIEIPTPQRRRPHLPAYAAAHSRLRVIGGAPGQLALAASMRSRRVQMPPACPWRRSGGSWGARNAAHLRSAYPPRWRMPRCRNAWRAPAPTGDPLARRTPGRVSRRWSSQMTDPGRIEGAGRRSECCGAACPSRPTPPMASAAVPDVAAVELDRTAWAAVFPAGSPHPRSGAGLRPSPRRSARWPAAHGPPAGAGLASLSRPAPSDPAAAGAGGIGAALSQDKQKLCKPRPIARGSGGVEQPTLNGAAGTEIRGNDPHLRQISSTARRGPGPGVCLHAGGRERQATEALAPGRGGRDARARQPAGPGHGVRAPASR